jgi:F-type H+-transporting ATPase subunit b
MFRLPVRYSLALLVALLSLSTASALRAENEPAPPAEGGHAGAEKIAAPAGGAGHGEDLYPADKGQFNVRFRKADGGEEDAVFDLTKTEKRRELAEIIKEDRLVEMTEARNMTKPETDLGIWSLVVFLVLLLLLYKLAWGPMLKGLKKREENIAGALEAAQKASEEAQKMQVSLQAQMVEANQRVNALMDETRKAAARTQEEMLAKARADIATERERLRRELDTARDQALQDLSQYAARLATDVAARILRRDLNVEDQRRLVDEALGEMRQAAEDRNRVLTGT